MSTQGWFWPVAVGAAALMVSAMLVDAYGDRPPRLSMYMQVDHDGARHRRPTGSLQSIAAVPSESPGPTRSGGEETSHDSVLKLPDAARTRFVPGSQIVDGPDQKFGYYVSRGPNVWLVEVSYENNQVVRRWLLGMEHAESVRRRNHPTVGTRWLAVGDEYGKVVVVDRVEGNVYAADVGVPILTSPVWVTGGVSVRTRQGWKIYALPHPTAD